MTKPTNPIHPGTPCHSGVSTRFSMAGFTLLEVLIALLVLSIGLLGLAALQTIGMKFNHQSYQRTQAVFQAYDILDRIRANPRGRESYKNVPGNFTVTNTNCIAVGTACTAEELANFDIAVWKRAVAETLVDGRASVCLGTINNTANLPCAPGGSVHRVAITWQENDLRMRVDVEAQL